MLDEPRVRKSGSLTAAAKGRAVLERTKAPKFAAKGDAAVGWRPA